MIVLTGRDKGKKGEVFQVMPKDGRALVRGVNVVRRHQRQTAPQEGGIISKEAPIHLSNLALEDPKDGKPTRVGFKILDDGRKVRVAKRSGEDHRGEEIAMAEDEKPAKAPSPTAGKAARTAASPPGRPRPARRAGGDKAAKGRKARPRARATGRQGCAQGEKAARTPRPKDYKPRMKTHYEKVVREEMTKQFGYKNRDADPAHREDRAQHGRGRGGQRPQEGRRRRQGSWR